MCYVDDPGVRAYTKSFGGNVKKEMKKKEKEKVKMKDRSLYGIFQTALAA